MAWYPGYTYRKRVTLSRESGAVSNYQMLLYVGESSGASGGNVDCGGKCLPTFNDLLFTSADGVTVLSYWIESISGTTPNQLATVWIKFDYIGTIDTAFYMYYGKADAVSISSGNDTFILFDDFSTATGLWSVQSGMWQVLAGNLEGFCYENTAASILCTDPIAVSDNYAVDASIQAQYGLTTKNCQSGLVINSAKVNSPLLKGYWLDAVGYDKWIIMDIVGGLTLSSADTGFNATTLTKYSLRKNGTSHTLYINDVLKVTHSYSWSIAPQYVGCYVAYTHNYADFKNFRVRQYLATEPAWGSWGSAEEEPVEVLDSIQVSVPESYMIKGQQQQATAVAVYTSGKTSDITTTVVWSSSNTSVATIDANGIITAIKSGSATITANNIIGR